MLDDLKYIHSKDVQDALGVAEKQYLQLTYKFDLSGLPKTFNSPSNVVYAGMGGSSLAAYLIETWPKCTVPFEICRNYSVPEYVNENTLFICSSYSGNTEETIAALEDAIKRKAKIVVIAGGGKLQEIASKYKLPFILLPKATQPRYAVMYNFVAAINILEKAKLTNAKNITKQLATTSKNLQKYQESWLPLVAKNKNPAKQLALELIGTTPVVYSGQALAPAAYKWKISFNENAKNVAWQGIYSEFSHNEFIGWSSHPTNKPYSIIDLISDYDHPQINKRIKITSKLLSGNRPHPQTVKAQGKTVLDQLLSTVLFGDFTSIYLALLNGVNPTPVDLVEKMKLELI